MSKLVTALVTLAVVGVSDAAYTCDASTCVLPKCNCASVNPPGGIAGANAPQFVTITFDDAVQAYTFPAALDILSSHKNPNGCPAVGTFFVSTQYTDYNLVTQWYGMGNEVACHTMNHVGNPPKEEIGGSRMAINSFAGIPRGKLAGFRSPFLNYSAATFQNVAELGFEYDSSLTALGADSFWPYTLDNGIANDCYSGICDSGLKVPGFWEIPMYAVMDGATPHLMDPNLDSKPETVLQWLKDNFNRHYNGNRSPFGIYLHPAHISKSPGINYPQDQVRMLKEFASWASQQADVWFVTNQQLLSWMKNPVDKTKMGDFAAVKCQTKAETQEICNGVADVKGGQIDAGLPEMCNFPGGSFSTCYGCPATEPSVANPVPGRAKAAGTSGARCPVPDNCDTLWWDPIACSCLCQNESCKFIDNSKPIDFSNGNRTDGKGASANGKSGSNGTTNAPTFLLATLIPLIGLWNRYL
ncbi:glycoside hydrolase/deacetylase [Basidiobolus meristosporus CBS 931.73]|uniref:Glycoside hydrolase/deacetylase n=1 Tax=Basidiobolus meristosporus CBS 931.73 TaxID=1314790 RepID=A0A1Y1XVP3_9FUNG|nr:glycoside hydrolase/deacetylase [Basidiobolus meristosporus CBS 931.73]|eukprot:ORX89556.1 glycoside hydrolase/deacetylase [Basidiobolus meristosporus CBS 931.73]